MRAPKGTGAHGVSKVGSERRKTIKGGQELPVLLVCLHSTPQENRNLRLIWRFIPCFKSYEGKERILRKDFSFQDLLTRNKAVA